MKGMSMSPRLLVASIAVIVGYVAVVGHGYFSKEADHRAIAMLNQMRYQLAKSGVEKPEENIGLEFGFYAGCRTAILEHLVAGGCIGFRLDESIRSIASPERIRDIAQMLCHTQNCEYDEPFVLAVRYFRISRSYTTDNSITVVREQSGGLTRYWLEGRKK